MTRDEALDTVGLVANSLGDIAAVGVSPSVDARRLGRDLEAHLREALAALRAAPPAPAPELVALAWKCPHCGRHYTRPAAPVEPPARPEMAAPTPAPTREQWQHVVEYVELLESCQDGYYRASESGEANRWRTIAAALSSPVGETPAPAYGQCRFCGELDGAHGDWCKRPVEPAARPPEMPEREVQLGVIEFHSPQFNPGLIERFYAVRDDLTAAGSIVDVWLMDIATVLAEFGYTMRVTTKKPLPVPSWRRTDRKEPTK